MSTNHFIKVEVNKLMLVTTYRRLTPPLITWLTIFLQEIQIPGRTLEGEKVR